MDETDHGLKSLLGDLEERQTAPARAPDKTRAPRSSVRLDPERCVGCAACMRACPTEAIRIRDQKAVIKAHLCIDCGECVRVCPHKAGVVLADPLSSIHEYEYKIAMPEASLFGQFVPSILPDDILAGLLDLGFDEVCEASLGTERASLLLREYLAQYKGPKPLMTSFCPVVVRLIQLRFPELIDLVIPVDSALELTAREVKEAKSRETGIPIEKIGAFYLAGCPARITTIHHPYTGGKTYLNGAIAIEEIYRDLMFAIRNRQKNDHPPPRLMKSTGMGIRWGALGGEVEALGLENTITVSDMKHLLRVIEEIDNHMLSDIEFIECRACYGGCAGGPLLVDNPYRGRAKIQKLGRMLADEKAATSSWGRDHFERFKKHFDNRVAPLSVEGLDPDPSRAIEKMAQKAEILKSLPGIDCGSCGAPNCRALADDIVRGEANVMYCLFKLRDAFFDQRDKAKRKE